MLTCSHHILDVESREVLTVMDHISGGDAMSHCSSARTSTFSDVRGPLSRPDGRTGPLKYERQFDDWVNEIADYWGRSGENAR